MVFAFREEMGDFPSRFNWWPSHVEWLVWHLQFLSLFATKNLITTTNPKAQKNVNKFERQGIGWSKRFANALAELAQLVPHGTYTQREFWSRPHVGNLKELSWTNREDYRSIWWGSSSVWNFGGRWNKMLRCYLTVKSNRLLFCWMQQHLEERKN